jgi:AraC-like DNA-binding protein
VGTSEPTVAALYAQAFVEHAAFRGLRRPAALDLRSPFARVRADDYARLVDHAARELDDASIGLSFGVSIGGMGFGLLGVAAATAETLGDSVRSLIRFEPLTSTMGDITPRVERDRVVLQWNPHSRALPLPVIEGVLAGWVSFGRFFLGQDHPAIELWFAHAPLAAPSVYEERLRCRLRFNTDTYALVEPRELLDARPRCADRQVHESMSGWLGECAQLAGSSTLHFVRNVADLVGARLADGPIDESALADALAMSPRTLQRRLEQDGMSYRQLLDRVRAKKSIVELVRGAPSLLEVGAQIGYVEQSSFCRAFRKWTGRSPVEFKRLLPKGFGDARHA